MHAAANTNGKGGYREIMKLLGSKAGLDAVMDRGTHLQKFLVFG
jgi:hypothetical protein